MTSVSQFSQYLLRLEPQRHPARLALFNFTKHFLDPELAFTPEVLQLFYGRVLQFDQWRNDAQVMSDVVRSDLAGYLKQYVKDPETAGWPSLRHPDTLQVIPLKLHMDFVELARNEYESRQKSGERLQVVRLSDNQSMVLLLSPSGHLEVQVFPHLAIVVGARLRLVSPVTHLFYTPELELSPHVRQILDGSLLTTHCFHVDVDGVHGLVTRGPTFQKFETFIRAKLVETQDLFYSLKKLERHFINPQTDPYYKEIVHRLERAVRLLNHPTLENLSEAERALNRGRVCLKNVFPNDRLLSLLITHLENGLNKRQQERSAP